MEDGPSHAPEVGVVADLPREVSLDDETVLDQVNFTEPRSVEPLSPLQQATLLAQWYVCVYMFVWMSRVGGCTITPNPIAILIVL